MMAMTLMSAALTCCSDNGNNEVEPPAKEKQEWTMTIPAVMYGPTRATARQEGYLQPAFGPDDRIYVYNTTKHVLLGSL